ncbi:MAG: hypothetical protein GY856_50435, partial [bacterium]|nr:hypothetical protein [bacterium]
RAELLRQRQPEDRRQLLAGVPTESAPTTCCPPAASMPWVSRLGPEARVAELRAQADQNEAVRARLVALHDQRLGPLQDRSEERILDQGLKRLGEPLLARLVGIPVDPALEDRRDLNLLRQEHRELEERAPGELALGAVCARLQSLDHRGEHRGQIGGEVVAARRDEL